MREKLARLEANQAPEETTRAPNKPGAEIINPPHDPAQANPKAAAVPPTLALRSAIFRKKRQPSWEKLDQLISRIDRKGLKTLSTQEAVDLPILYQTAVSSLALARHIVLDQSLTAYLENLTLRAHIAVYGPRQDLWAILGSFFHRDFPRSIRTLKGPFLVAFLAFALGLASGFWRVQANEAAFHQIIPISLADGRDPAASVKYLRDEVIFAPWSGFEKSFISFASFLFEHNSTIAFLCFGLGFALGIPVIVLLFQNGETLGALLALHWSKGLTIDFIGWVSIHGVTEILALLVAGAAGLGVAERIFLPGERGRLENLTKEGPTAAAAMVGAVFMLLVAGLIEGGFRQLIGATFPRLFIAGLTLFGWIYYFLFFGQDAER
ncbi:MAG: stage II sporulation protein M [Deltaproteobacteria bacterium]|nr:stage II sporulation protein M [Deltaproteobacteria bacterium]